MDSKGNTNDIVPGLVFAHPEHLRYLIRHGHLTLIDATHNTNSWRWLLYTLMVRDEWGCWIPTAHALCAGEGADILAAALSKIRQ